MEYPWPPCRMLVFRKKSHIWEMYTRFHFIYQYALSKCIRSQLDLAARYSGIEQQGPLCSSGRNGFSPNHCHPLPSPQFPHHSFSNFFFKLYNSFLHQYAITINTACSGSICQCSWYFYIASCHGEWLLKGRLSKTSWARPSVLNWYYQGNISKYNIRIRNKCEFILTQAHIACIWLWSHTR